MEIKLLSGALGAEITGIDLKDTSDQNIKEINNLFNFSSVTCGLSSTGCTTILWVRSDFISSEMKSHSEKWHLNIVFGNIFDYNKGYILTPSLCVYTDIFASCRLIRVLGRNYAKHPVKFGRC